MRLRGVAPLPFVLITASLFLPARSCEHKATPKLVRTSVVDVIVTLAEPPVAEYRGGIPGYLATAPEPGRKIDFESEAVRRYQQYLAARQEVILQEIHKIDPSVQRLGQQSTVSNSLTLRLGESAIPEVEKISGVRRVERSKERRPLNQ